MVTEAYPYMRAEEVAVELDVSIGTVYNYRSDGLLVQEQVGRKRYFIRKQVLELKAKLAEVQRKSALKGLV